MKIGALRFIAFFLCAIQVFGYQQSWRLCTRIIDGDTIVLDGEEKVRLIGIDTPELDDQRVALRRLAEESCQFVRNLIESKRVRLEYDQERTDKYGRTLAYVYLEDGTFVNAEIVKRGYGFAYVKYPFKYMDDFRRYEREARENQRGLWYGGKPDAIGTSVATTSADAKTIVYITVSGAKYHSASCRSLSKSRIPITLDEAIKKGYTPCSICAPPILGTAKRPYMISKEATEEITVYVTKTGSKYHKVSCSSLRQSRKAMSLKDACAAGYTPCSRCNPPRCKA